ncbi:Abscission ut checkpoint regulator [Hyphodiscus hymeniophilus]|uniref:Abscission ut checkpoint regulator n=1 Tax=Hyphodiscus hymeniophilus TaxID=353542 RepID=A0A9P6VNQ5_9HELO|nr:Abscission ut checkpoint regulator [Hyphodiscus hymeniophilus]
MSDPPSYDDDLLARLNALKKSSIQLDSTKSKPIFNNPKQATPDSDLSARLRSLRNGSLSPSPAPAAKAPQSRLFPVPTASFDATEEHDPLRSTGDIDDKTLDELLAELGPDDQWNLHPEDPDDIQKLLDEAKTTLPSNNEEPELPEAAPDREEKRTTTGRTKDGRAYLTKDLDMSVFALDDGDSKAETEQRSRLEDESREAQDIVAKLMDEVALEKTNEPPESDEDTKNTARDDGEDHDSRLSLPSAPTKLPEPTTTEPSRKSIDFESDITARMAVLRGLGATNELGLPSAPTFKPMDKPVKGVMKKYTDDEVESWCIICQDDATVKCVGCDGDLYCANCWKEGHIGPDVGWEERKHKWTKFRKPN